MGKIIKAKYPELDSEDQEAIRQHAVAAMNLTQQAKKIVNQTANTEEVGSNAFIDGVRKFCMDVRELDIDLIDRINPFSEAYAILSKSMNEESLKQVHAIISAKKINMSIEEARELAKRALKFKLERGRLPLITSQDPWEKKMAEGVAYLNRIRSSNV
jgi:dsRNA-specific ribonuclease